MINGLMTRLLALLMLYTALLFSGCSVFNHSKQEMAHLPETIFDSDINKIKNGDLYYYQEVRIDSLIEIQQPKSYAIFNSEVSPMPKDISILFLKVKTTEYYLHKDNPFFWAYSNVNHFIEEYKGMNDYGMYRSLEVSDSLMSIGEFPSQSEYLFLPVKSNAISSIIKMIEDEEPILFLEGRTSGDTAWAACFYEKERVDYSLLLSFSQRDSITNSWKEVAQCYVDDSVTKSIQLHHTISAFPLNHYRNRININTEATIVNDTNSHMLQSKDIFDYRDYLKEYSILDSALAFSFEIKGMMRIDSIIYGINVVRFHISQDSNRYVVYSVVPNKKESERYIGKTERLFEGKTYYLELTPYFNIYDTNYHNRGLYVNGFVIRDLELPYQEWINVYISKNIIGYRYYKSKRKLLLTD